MSVKKDKERMLLLVKIRKGKTPYSMALFTRLPSVYKVALLGFESVYFKHLAGSSLSFSVLPCDSGFLRSQIILYPSTAHMEKGYRVGVPSLNRFS